MNGPTLQVGTCRACGTDHHPIARQCPICRGAVHVTERPGSGTIRTWTSVARPPPGFVGPRHVVVVHLERDDGTGALVLASSTDDTLRSGETVLLRTAADGRIEAERAP